MSHSAHSLSLYMAPYLIRLILELYPILIHYQTQSDYAQNQKVVGSQSESSITSPKSTRELSAMVEDPSRLSAGVGSQ